MASRRMCTWAGSMVEVLTLPEIKGNQHRIYFTGIGEQTKGWLQAAQYKGRSGARGFSCPADSVTDARNRSAPAFTLLLAEFRSFHVHVRPGALGSHGIGASLVVEMGAHLKAHYTTIQEHMASSQRAVLALNYGGEWPGRRFVAEVEQLLQSCGIDASRVIFLHYNMGAILEDERRRPSTTDYAQRYWAPLLEWLDHTPSERSSGPGLRIRQSYWNFYIERTMVTATKNEAVRRHVATNSLCNRSTMLHDQLYERLSSGNAVAKDAFLLLGGVAKDFRGLVTLEMLRRGLLSRGRWSAGKYSFCNSIRNADMPQTLLSAGPFSSHYARALLANRSLVRSLCTELPKVLDVAPDVKTPKTEFDSPHQLWRDTRFAVVFETTVETASGPDSFSYVTEKALKPLLNLRPFVMIGSAGTLATLRSLGFRSFGSVVNESYDGISARDVRAYSALDEAERLVQLPDSAWRPSIETVVHNQRHLLCGGLRKELAAHAERALSLAQTMATGLEPPTPARHKHANASASSSKARDKIKKPKTSHSHKS